ncbi:MAG TPA: PEP-CTERM sorting domain-containing protein [Acetobacteraceae bacterium]
MTAEKHKPDHRYAAWVIASGMLLTMLGTAGSARAEKFDYTLSGDLSGTLGTQTLTDDPFTWTVIGNPVMPALLAGQIAALPAFSDVITLGGFGTATPTVATYVAQSPMTASAGFVNASLTQGLTWTAPALGTSTLYQKQASLPVQFQAAAPLSTTLGTLSVTGATNLVYKTTGGPPPPPTHVAYSLHGKLTGAIGDVTLTDANFTWQLIAGTSATTTLEGQPALIASRDVLHIQGIGALIPSETIAAIEAASNSTFGFVNLAVDQGLTWTAGAFASYLLGTAIGPLPVSFFQAGDLPTSGGTLQVTGVNELTFSGRVLRPIPEPSTLALLIAGLAGFVAIRRPQRR